LLKVLLLIVLIVLLMLMLLLLLLVLMLMLLLLLLALLLCVLQQRRCPQSEGQREDWVTPRRVAARGCAGTRRGPTTTAAAGC